MNVLTRLDITHMRQAGRVAAEALRFLQQRTAVGVSTRHIEELFDMFLLGHQGMKPSFKGFSGYPASICVSLNDEVIHGIPSAKRIICAGDMVSLDLGIHYRGIHVDTAYTFVVGQAQPRAVVLMDVTRTALQQAIEKVRPGNTVGDIGYCIQQYAEANNCGVVRAFVGHGIGYQLHQPPEVPNFGEPGTGEKLVAGMAIAIEPMITAGMHEVTVDDDGWTVRTKDASLSAHYEHTVVITRSGPLVVTA